MLELTDQQGGLFDAEVFDDVVFETGIVWRRIEPTEDGWARLDGPAEGWGAGAWGGGTWGSSSGWTSVSAPATGWVRLP